jgi:hypothetical protein
VSTSPGFESSFLASQPGEGTPTGGPLRPPLRYRHRAHALAREREYRLGARSLRWHDAERPDRGLGQLAWSQLEAVQLGSEPAGGGRRRYLIRLVPRRGPALELASDSAHGGLSRRPQDAAYRRFVRNLLVAARQAQPRLRVQALPEPALGGMLGPVAGLTVAAALGMLHGPGAALAAFALATPAAQLLARWWRLQRPAASLGTNLPRELLP